MLLVLNLEEDVQEYVLKLSFNKPLITRIQVEDSWQNSRV